MTIHEVNNATELESALTAGAASPGDIIELDDGIYLGSFVSTLDGTLSLPIIIRPHNPGMATIDRAFIISGIWNHLYDLNFTDSRITRVIEEYGIYSNQMGTHIHGCWISNLHSSGINAFGMNTGEISENVIYDNGFPGHAHALYTHNNPGGYILIARNIMGRQLGGYSLHIYSDGANYGKDYDIKDNVFINQDVQVGTTLGVANLIYHNNIHYKLSFRPGIYSGDGTCDGTIHENYFMDMIHYEVQRVKWSSIVEANNEVFGGADAASAWGAGYTLYVSPGSKTWVKAFTKSARWVGMVTIYNLDLAGSVAVDLDSICTHGDYILRNGQNMNETWQFHHDIGVNVNIPMTMWTASHIIGIGAGVNNLPKFGSFVVERLFTPSASTIMSSSTLTKKFMVR